MSDDAISDLKLKDTSYCNRNWSMHNLSIPAWPATEGKCLTFSNEDSHIHPLPRCRIIGGKRADRLYVLQIIFIFVAV